MGTAGVTAPPTPSSFPPSPLTITGVGRLCHGSNSRGLFLILKEVKNPHLPLLSPPCSKACPLFVPHISPSPTYRASVLMVLGARGFSVLLQPCCLGTELSLGEWQQQQQWVRSPSLPTSHKCSLPAQEQAWGGEACLLPSATTACYPRLIPSLAQPSWSGTQAPFPQDSRNSGDTGSGRWGKGGWEGKREEGGHASEDEGKGRWGFLHSSGPKKVPGCCFWHMVRRVGCSRTTIYPLVPSQPDYMHLRGHQNSAKTKDMAQSPKVHLRKQNM